MQTFITSLIIIAATLYTLNRWLPFRLKQRLWQLVGKQKTIIPINVASNVGSNGGSDCGSCSSCGNCGSGNNTIKIIKK
ncbi:hypothetical protein [Sapientia aquatica]|uniref:Uncharacterized protein n=1 Tax=Sapientia aquatica TaxID=1549640 RepID=A0A4V3AV54_9BURK|nr:hypothetical protein [Sapientia aquatica]TDK68346.1 hypothetical protein E2I14_02045 [Sapientia aquatica]